MAKYIRISCLGPKPYDIGSDSSYQNAVDKMIKHWEYEIEKVLPDKPDIIVLPEACDSPKTDPMDFNHDYHRVLGDSMLNLFSRIARENNCYIAYSSIRKAQDGSWRNSTRIIDMTGKVIGTYNKNHPVMNEITQVGILCGKEAPIIECSFGRVACVICFDLNFDELRSKYVRGKPDLIIFSSMYHGGLMQNYWAYSCKSYFAGAVAGLPCTIISPIGELIATSTNNFNYITSTVNLDYVVVHPDDNLDRLEGIKKKYGPKVRVHDAGFLDAVLITSETDEITAKEIILEFGIELHEDYLARSLAHHHNPENMER